MTETVRRAAENRVAAALLGESTDGRERREQLARSIVKLVLFTLTEVDADTLEAGRRELVLALPANNPGKHYQRNVVRAVWLNMLAEAAR